MLPTRCFISHAYEDAAVCERLVATLPSHVEPVIFPPIVVSPNKFVSSSLVDALLGCDGLLYLRGGQSEKSFWVAFERDYALRAGKPTFSVDPISLEIVPSVSTPLDLAVRMVYVQEDRPIVDHIQRFLADERHFDVFQAEHVGTGWAREIEESISDLLQRGGFVVACVSKFWEDLEMRFASEELKVVLDDALHPDGADATGRILFASLDGTRPPVENWVEEIVDLRRDGDRPFQHKVDDLMVRLYWLIAKKTGLGGGG